MTIAAGILYLCATPIGNLEDMTFRAVRILREVTVIAAEDTRHTRKLLSHFDIHTPLISYHEHNKLARGPELIARLTAGDTIAVVSDAGLPGISDPGADLVQLALASAIPVTVIPGACAALTALVASGLDSRQFLFSGFLPKSGKKRKEVLARVAASRETLIFYESPHHLLVTLRDLAAVLGGVRQAVVGRELTKKFEEFRRGTLAELQHYFQENRPKGEFTLVIAGAEPKAASELPELAAKITSLPEAVKELMATGLDKKTAIKQLAVQCGLSRREVYQAVLTGNTNSGE